MKSRKFNTPNLKSEIIVYVDNGNRWYYEQGETEHEGTFSVGFDGRSEYIILDWDREVYEQWMDIEDNFLIPAIEELTQIN